MNNEYNITIGGGFFGLFFIILFLLKVCGIGVVANWSWWWITAPLWAPLAITLAVIFIIILFYLIFAIIVYAKDLRNRNWP